MEAPRFSVVRQISGRFGLQPWLPNTQTIHAIHRGVLSLIRIRCSIRVNPWPSCSLPPSISGIPGYRSFLSLRFFLTFLANSVIPVTSLRPHRLGQADMDVLRNHREVPQPAARPDRGYPRVDLAHKQRESILILRPLIASCRETDTSSRTRSQHRMHWHRRSPF